MESSKPMARIVVSEFVGDPFYVQFVKKPGHNNGVRKHDNSRPKIKED